MSLGGEAVVDQLTNRESDLLQEAWVWRAIQQFAKGGMVGVRLGHDYGPIIEAGGRIYRLPADKQDFLDAARADQ